ncbi:uncharacterized protein PAE49_004198 [Odontesthes bonariensis]
MYFCRGVCSSENSLIQTEMKRSAATRQGRYSMEYDGGDGVFTVTIRRLRAVDTGRYHCEVERTFNVSYQEVSLKVLDASTVPPGSPRSINTTLQTEEEPLPTTFILQPFEEKEKQKGSTSLTDTTVVIIVSGSLAFLVCAIIPLIFYRHWRSNEGQNSAAGNKAEEEEIAENETTQDAVRLQSLEQESGADDNIQYAAIYEALDPKTLD